jgi:hypothetical protein
MRSGKGMFHGARKVKTLICSGARKLRTFSTVFKRSKHLSGDDMVFSARGVR